MRRFLLISASVLMFSCPAMAEPIDFSTILPDGFGGTLKDGNSNVDATLGKAVARALFNNPGPDVKLSDEEKFKRGMLGTKVAAGGMIELTAEEIAMAKKAVAQAFSPQVVAVTWPLLDPALKSSVPEAPKP